MRAAAEPEQKSSGGEVFFTDKNGDGQRATPEEYEAAKAAGNTYQASTVTGDLPEWAAGATADSDISLSLGDAFAFAQVPAATNFVASGPELMNGRLAMIGFVAALGCEIATGETVGQQVAQSPVGVAVVTMLIVGGTLISYCSNTSACWCRTTLPKWHCVDMKARLVTYRCKQAHTETPTRTSADSANVDEDPICRRPRAYGRNTEMLQ